MCVSFEKLSNERKRSTMIDKYFDSDNSSSNSRMPPLPPPSVPPANSNTTHSTTAIQEHYKFGLIWCVCVCAYLFKWHHIETLAFDSKFIYFKDPKTIYVENIFDKISSIFCDYSI